MVKQQYAAAAKSLQSWPTLCDPIDSSPPGSPFPGILQARTLEWVAISFSNGWKWKVKVKLLSRAQLLATPWTAASQAPPSLGFSRQEYWRGLPLPSPLLTILGGKYDCGCCCWVTKLCPTLETPWTVARQAPLSMEFSRQEYWSRLSFPAPGDLSNSGIEPRSPALQADSLLPETQGKSLSKNANEWF